MILMTQSELLELVEELREWLPQRQRQKCAMR